MMNQVIVVGRLVKDPEVKKLESGREVSKVVIAVNRSFKNADGEYESDFIDCVVWEGMANNIAEYCKKGDIIGIRGRLQTTLVEKEDGSKIKYTEVVAEKITFLSSGHIEKEDNENKEE